MDAMARNNVAMIVAAGIGERSLAAKPKQYLYANGQSLIRAAALAFLRHHAIDAVCIVINPAHIKEYEKETADLPLLPYALGGDTRQQSVANGLTLLAHYNPTNVLIHDAARPLVDKKMVSRLITALKQHKAAIVAVPVKATVKKVNAKTLMIEETPRRDAQTPQGFHKDVLLRAHRQNISGEVTDDAMLAERMGIKVKVVMGDYRNIKVTTPEDLKIAKGLMG
jgi:2-C-methyl-D-erythritol 4-phosphate cytidylyltransferase